MHHKTACCSCAGDRVQGHRELNLLGHQVVEERGVNPVRDQCGVDGPVKHLAGTVLPVSTPHITPGLEEARVQRETWDKGFVLPEQRRTPVGASA